MNAEYINPFITVSADMLQMVANIKSTKGKVFMKASPLTADNVVIIIGLTGEFKGQVFFSMSEKTACTVASGMMFGTEVPILDEMAKSAIAELGNMILGNIATKFYNDGVKIDITPPTILVGSNLAISTREIKTMCVPLEFENGGKMDIDIAIAE